MKTGVLLLDKPSGWTSNAALQRVRKLYHVDKAGHGGTLDPMAEGLLPVFLGEATRYAGFVLSERKAYIATVRFGTETHTADREGDVTRTAALPEINDNLLQETLARFVGQIVQRPPVYSAIKQKGLPLYTWARMGMDVLAPERTVTIHSLRVIARSTTVSEPPRLHELKIEVDCGSGTYIRSLAEDIGRALGSAAHLFALRRTRVGGFDSFRIHTLEAVDRCSDADRPGLLTPIEQALQHLPAINLQADEVERLIRGQRFSIRDERITEGPSRLVAPDGGFLGLGQLDPKKILRVIRLMPTEARMGIAE